MFELWAAVGVEDTGEQSANSATQGSSAAVQNAEAKQFNADEMVDVDAIQTHFFDYVDFAKNSLLSPTRIMDVGNYSWIHGLMNIVLLTLLTTWFTGNDYFIKGIIYQAAFAGLLFLINRFLFNNEDNYLMTIYKYGTLLTTQVLLFLLFAND